MYFGRMRNGEFFLHIGSIKSDDPTSAMLTSGYQIMKSIHTQSLAPYFDLYSLKARFDEYHTLPILTASKTPCLARKLMYS